MQPYGFKKHLQEMGVSCSSKVLVAVSGGMDSMCLLHALYTSPLGLQCTVAHVNFHLRGEASNADQELVERWCGENGIPCLVKQVETVQYARERGISVEMAARDLRYAWFSELMEQGNYDFLAIAHHANDNAETLLLNLVRGTGMKGLCGILPRRGKLIRPLLPHTREEIEKYVLFFEVPYRTDHTNLESDYARNRIRNEVFPQLGKINPSLIKTLNRNIRYFSMAYGILERMAEEERRQLVQPVPEGEGGMRIASLLEREHWPYLLYEWLQGYGFHSAQVDDVATRIENASLQRIFSASHVLIKERGFLKLYPGDLASPVEPLEIFAPGTYLFAGKKLSFEICENSPELMHILPHLDEGVLAVSADTLAFPLICRPMREGDRFIPFGMRGSKKISDFFTDIKIDHLLRHRIPLLWNGSASGENKNPESDLICLPGFRIDSRYKVTSETVRVLLVKTAF